MTSIDIQRLSVSYPVGTNNIPALHNITCVIEAASFVALVGPSGCGKTTLLRAISGLLEPTHGSIAIGTLSPDQARQQRMIGLLFQRTVLLPWKTARQNVLLPLELAGYARSQQHEIADHFLHMVGLSQFANAYPHQLSGGMQQRVSVARALASKPAILLMDEPFSGLDEISREQLHIEFLRVWATTHPTVVFVTHSLAEAVFLSDRVLMLSEHPGTLILDSVVPLPRPRTAAMLEEEAFQHQVAHLRKQLRTSTSKTKTMEQ